MLFGNVLAFAALAMAVPAPSNNLERSVVADRTIPDTPSKLQERQNGPLVTGIVNALDIVTTSINDNLAAINALGTSINSATEPVASAATAALKNIRESIVTATGALQSSLAATGTNLAGVLTTLSTTEKAAITKALNDFVTALTKLQNPLKANLLPVLTAAQKAVADEAAAVLKALGPFLTPLNSLPAALTTFIGSINLDPTQLGIVYTAVVNFLKALVALI